MISKEHADTIYDTLEKVRKHMPALTVRISGEGIEFLDKTKQIYMFNGDTENTVIAAMSFLLGVQIGAKYRSLKDTLKQL